LQRQVIRHRGGGPLPIQFPQQFSDGFLIAADCYSLADNIISTALPFPLFCQKQEGLRLPWRVIPAIR
jgi:hypothetical protein